MAPPLPSLGLHTPFSTLATFKKAPNYPLSYLITLISIFIGLIYTLSHLDVFVTSEDILMFIIIICCFTPIGDVFTPLWVVLIMSRH